MTKDANELIGALYSEHAHRFFRAAKGAFNGNENMAEEAVQRTFERACENKDQLLASENPHGWMRLALKHTISRMISEQIRESELVERVGSLSVIHTPHHIDEQDIDNLFGNVKDNPDYQIIKKHYVYGYTIEEIALELGISIDACTKRIQRARERMQKKLRKNKN